MAYDYVAIYVKTGNTDLDNQTYDFLVSKKPGFEANGDYLDVIAVSSADQAKVELDYADAAGDPAVVWAHGNDDGDYDAATGGHFSATIMAQDTGSAYPASITTDVHQIIYCGRNGYDVESDRAWAWSVNNFYYEPDNMDEENTYL